MAPQIDWNLLGPPINYGEKFNEGLQAGRQVVQQRNYQNALGQLFHNPEDTNALAAAGAVNPQAAMTFMDRSERQRTRAQQERAQQLQQAREQIGIVNRLLSGVADEATYQQARQAASGLGIDLSEVPESFDPAWVQQTRMQAQALSGELERELMAVTPGTEVIDKRTGQPVYKNPDRPRYYALPPGGRLELDPSYQGPVTDTPGPPVGAEVGGYRFKGGNPNDRNNWEPAGGASPSNGSATFP